MLESAAVCKPARMRPQRTRRCASSLPSAGGMSVREEYAATLPPGLPPKVWDSGMLDIDAAPR